ncbi:MAG: hypothetical protein GY797_33625 [Deltaproteobacteria bacterium]|nr:hypothetical protein [Deltaproteobacteria bacterium]
MKKLLTVISLLFLTTGVTHGATFENVESKAKVYSVSVNNNKSELIDYAIHIDGGNFTLDGAVSVGDVGFDAVAGHGISVVV